MALPSSGVIKLSDIQKEFGGPTNPIKLSNYYKGGANVSASDNAPNVPTSGLIKLSNFYGAGKNVVGQIQYTTPGTYSFVVPAGVTSLCAVCVGSDILGGNSSVTVSGVAVCSAGYYNARVGDGGGNGGTSSGGAEGGGGAGGYSGNGGAAGQNGAGGGGGGGGTGGFNPFTGTSFPGGVGGGVGLLGQGASGLAGTNGTSGSGDQPGGPGGAGSGGSGQNYGGGDAAMNGGALSYKNNIAVTPGQTVQIRVAPTRGAVRLIWGGGRAFPSTNTGNL